MNMEYELNASDDRADPTATLSVDQRQPPDFAVTPELRCDGSCGGETAGGRPGEFCALTSALTVGA